MPTPAITPEFKHFLRTGTTEDLTVLSRYTKNLEPVEVRALSREIQKRTDAQRDSSRTALKTLPDASNHDAIAIMLRHSVDFHIEQELKKNGTVGDVEN